MVRARMALLLSVAVLFGSSLPAETKKDPAPSFPKGTPWLNSKPLQIKDLEGKVVVLHFWTYGCINCQRNYPVYKGWMKKYADKKVALIGVHTPEFAAERNIDRVKLRAKNNGLTFPIAIDNSGSIWRAWRTQYWPTVFLIDRKGFVRYHWAGELHLDKEPDRKFAEHIDELLAEKE
jgi:thiol-disulfide isomerase/thioredoxin